MCAKNILRQVFDRLRLMRQICDNNPLKLLCLGEEDAFICLPTGGGKSLIYQLPALLYPGISLVISPLLALIQDQLKGLLEKGIKAESINSKLSTEEKKAIMDDLYSGDPKTKILYVTPEQCQTARYFILKPITYMFKMYDIRFVLQMGLY